MKFIKALLIWIFLFGVGCGGRAPILAGIRSPDLPLSGERFGANPPSSNLSVGSILVGEIDFRVVQADVERSSLPDLSSMNFEPEPGSFQKKENIYFGQHNRLVFNRVVNLAQESNEDFYLAWTDRLGSDQITAVSYRVSKMDPLNRSTKLPKYYKAIHSESEKAWFLNLNELVRKTQVFVDPSELFWIQLEFQLESKRQVLVDLGMRVLPFVDKVHIEHLSEDTISNPQFFIDRSFREGWVLHRERIKNPYSRPVKVWLKSNGEIHLHIGIKLMSYLEREFDPPQQVIRDVRSTASFRLDRVNIIRGKISEIVFLSLGQWASVQLDPKETVELEWVAFQEGRAPRCELPPDYTAIYRWKERRRGEEMEVISETRKILNRIHLAGFEGDWKRSAILSEEDLEEEDLKMLLEKGVRSRLQFLFEDRHQSDSQFLGSTLHTWQPYRCQGYFEF